MNFSGSMCALVTPFNNTEIDFEALRRLVNFQIENGTSAVVPCGTTGESATLSNEEHRLVIEQTIQFVEGRVPVIAGTGSNNTAEAVALTKEAEKLGADGALLITPYYNKPTQEGLYAHYMAVADAVSIPIVLYNVPSRTAVCIAPETVARLAEHPNVGAIKEASGDLDYLSRLRGLSDITVLSGCDNINLALMNMGASGAISVLANVVPGLCAKLMEAAAGGDWATARDVHFRTFPLVEALFCETNPIPVKAALNMMGLVSSELRLPLTQISDGAMQRVRRELAALEILDTVGSTAQ